MKKVILGILALIFAIALVIGGYFLITSYRLQNYAVEEGVPCPYSWQEQWNGTYRLEINTAAYPDYSWGFESYPKNVIAVTEVSSDPGIVAFSILPLNMGNTYIQVYCEQTEPFAVRVFEIGMQIGVSEENEITVEKTEHKIYDGVITMGEEGDYPIQWWADSNGTVNLLIEEENNGSWNVVDYDSDGLEVTGPFYRQGNCGFAIQGKLAGVYPLAVYDGRDKALILELQVTEDLTASITDFAVEAYTVDRSGEHTELEGVAGGTIVLPAEAVVTGYSIKSEKGSVNFLMNDRAWDWWISASKTVEELAGKYVDHSSESKSLTVRGITLDAYGFTDGVVVTWSDGDRAMALYGEQEVPLADALAAAKQIAEANHEK